MSLHEELIEKLPIGWKIAYFSDNVIAVHPDYIPRAILIGQALGTPFAYWDTLEFSKDIKE